MIGNFRKYYILFDDIENFLKILRSKSSYCQNDESTLTVLCISLLMNFWLNCRFEIGAINLKSFLSLLLFCFRTIKFISHDEKSTKTKPIPVICIIYKNERKKYEIEMFCFLLHFFTYHLCLWDMLQVECLHKWKKLFSFWCWDENFLQSFV